MPPTCTTRLPWSSASTARSPASSAWTGCGRHRRAPKGSCAACRTTWCPSRRSAPRTPKTDSPTSRCVPRAAAPVTRWSSTTMTGSSGSSPRRRSRRAGRSVAQPLEGALGLALGVALRDGSTLVVGPLALGHGQLELGAAVLEVHTKRYERHALLARGAGERVDLLAVQEQLAATGRVELGA